MSPGSSHFLEGWRENEYKAQNERAKIKSIPIKINRKLKKVTRFDRERRLQHISFYNDLCNLKPTHIA